MAPVVGRRSEFSWPLLLGVLGSVVAIVLLWRSRQWPLIHVPAQMQYLGWLFTEGAVPYRDVFDMNFPGSYLLHVGIWQLVGESDAGWRVFEVSWLAATCAVMYIYCRPVVDRWGATAGAALFAVYHLADGASMAGERDFFVVIFLLAGALGVARYEETRGRMAWLVAAGLALGAAVAIKPVPALFCALCAVTAAGVAWRIGRSPVRALVVVAASGLVLPTLAMLWVWWVGGLGAFVDTYSDYVIPLYGTVGRGSLRGAVTFSMDYLVPLIDVAPRDLGAMRIVAALLVIGATLITFLVVLTEQLTTRKALVGLGVAYGIVHFFFQGKLWPYHMYPWVVFFCLMMAMIAGWTAKTAAKDDYGWSHHAAVAGRSLVCVLFVFILSGLSVRGIRGTKGVTTHNDIASINDAKYVEAMARDLATIVHPGSTVQQLDAHHMAIHALLKLRLRQPTRFIYEFHFFHDTADARIQALRRELIADLDTRRPAAIVIAPTDAWLIDFPELTALLHGTYVPAIQRTGYQIFVPRSASDQHGRVMSSRAVR